MSSSGEAERDRLSWFNEAVSKMEQQDLKCGLHETRPTVALKEILAMVTDPSSQTQTFQDSATFEKLAHLKLSSSSDSNVCILCGQTAKNCCSKCIDIPDSLGVHYTTTFYCDSKCQKVHWKKHESDCLAARDRNIIYRAASTAQQLCFINLKAYFHWGNIESLEKKSAWEWHFHMKANCVGQWPFPKDLISDMFDQEAMLAHNQCNSSVAVMGSALHLMLKGIRCKIEEIVVEIKNRTLYMIKRKNEDKDVELKDFIAPFHRLFRVTLLKSGEEYAIDLTGSQFGHGAFLSSWSEYRDQRVKRVIEVRDLGTSWEVLISGLSKPNFAYLKLHADCLNSHIEKWSKDNQMSLGALLKLPEVEYETGRRALLKEVAEGMGRNIELFYKENPPRSLYWNELSLEEKGKKHERREDSAW